MRTLAAATVAVALVAGACGGGNGSDTNALRYGVEFGVNLSDTFDPAASLSACDQVVLQSIYGTLVTYDDDNEMVPGLAESWELSDDLESMTLVLRDGLRFSDGSSYDAEAVKGGLEHLMTGEQTGSNLRDIDEIEVVDDTTLVIHFDGPGAATLPYMLSGREGMIPAPSVIEADTVDSDPVGAGPFQLESFDPGSSIMLTPNDEYEGPLDIDLPGLEYVDVGTGTPAMNALRAGDVDVVALEAEAIAALERDAHLDSDSRLSEQYLQLQFRIEGPFESLEVRQAVNHAINREELNDAVLGGAGELAWMPFPQDSDAYVPEMAERYPHDPERARELLAEAGYPDGFSFTMVIPGGGIVHQEQQAEILQSQLEAVGITVAIQRSINIAPEYYIQKIGDAFSAARLPDFDPTAQLRDQWGNFQFVAIHNFAERDDITELVEQANATTGEERDELIREAVTIVVEEALEAPLAFQPRNAAWDTRRVEGEVKASPSACIPIDISGARLS